MISLLDSLHWGDRFIPKKSNNFKYRKINKIAKTLILKGFELLLCGSCQLRYFYAYQSQFFELPHPGRFLRILG
jgi:hypothetical protein